MKFTVAADSKTTKIVLSGTINETSEPELHELQSKVTGGQLVFDCYEILYINSVGVSHWMHFLTDLRKLGMSYEFQRCSPTFVDYSIIIPSFLAGGSISSLAVPLSCESCDHQTLVVTEMRELATFAATPHPCPQCGKSMETDGIIDDLIP